MHALTKREKQIVALLVQGEKREAMAAELGIHVNTVDFHLANLRVKFGAVSLVTLAVRLVRSRAA